MVCIQKRRDEGILVRHDELEMEYQCGIEALRIEQEKVRQEENQKWAGIRDLLRWSF